MLHLANKRTAVYRTFDATGRLLYVGIGFNPRVRLRQHATSKAWWREVASHTVEWLESRPAALKAEAVAIRDENPLYNVRRHPYRQIVRPKLVGPVVALPVHAARDQIGDRATAAQETGQHTVIERHGRPVAVLVPVTWYISKGGDPREPLEDLASDGGRES